MQVRGAPLVGATAAYGVCLQVRRDPRDAAVEAACEALLATRPTAVNLAWALDEMRAALRGRRRVRAGRRRLPQGGGDLRRRRRDLPRHRRARRHADRGGRRAARPRAPVNVLTHCNAGWLATVDWGTALAPVYLAHDRGIDVHVWVDETRPRNQGARLTAWELLQHGVPHTVIADNAGGHLMQHGRVDLCLTGSDRTTARGDVCNKIGTYLKALAARDNDVPFYVALPHSTHRLEPLRRRRGDPDRGARRRRGEPHPRAGVGRPQPRRAPPAGGEPRRELRLRRDAGAARHRPHHRARGVRRVRRGASRPLPRAAVADMGTLHLVATPIGNLEDVTLRSVRVLREADLVLAEDTRRTRKLLDRCAIPARPLSLHAHNEAARVAQGPRRARRGRVRRPRLRRRHAADLGPRRAAGGGRHRGRPPRRPRARRLGRARRALRRGPAGDALRLSRLPPAQGAARGERCSRRTGVAPRPSCFFESPRRVSSALRDLAETLGDRPACVARELTKLHEEVVRGTPRRARRALRRRRCGARSPSSWAAPRRRRGPRRRRSRRRDPRAHRRRPFLAGDRGGARPRHGSPPARGLRAGGGAARGRLMSRRIRPRG